jgi:hypothetical protein
MVVTAAGGLSSRWTRGNRARSFSLTRGGSGGGPLKHHSSPLLGSVGSLHCLVQCLNMFLTQVKVVASQ